MKSTLDRMMTRARLGLAENSELSQSRARILITALAFVYLNLYYRKYGLRGDPSWYAAILVSLYLAGAIFWYALIRRFPAPSRFRKSLALTTDAGFVSIGMYLGGAHGVVLYPAYLWIIAGNGLRFGAHYLLTAMWVSLSGMTIAVALSSYWQSYLQVGVGLLAGMVLISGLLYSLVHRLQDTNRRLEERARESERLATHDQLTGLANRALFLARLEQELVSLQRQSGTIGLLFIDLDGFKSANDVHGHAVGDWLLSRVADRLREAVRRSDMVARIGGDEFAILLTGLHGRKEARAVAETVLLALSRPYDREDGPALALTASIGVAVAPDDGAQVDTLLHLADMAMYAGKRGGKCAVREARDLAVIPTEAAP